MLKLNLQLFSEGPEEDMILPDDFAEDAPPQAEIEVPTDTVEDTKPTETVEEPTQETPKLKIKYNHEEREIDLEEAKVLAQKGMNYDKLQERVNQLQSNPALELVQQQAERYGMTVEQYVEEVRKADEQARLDELLQQNIPEEYAKEMLENRKFREQYQAQQKAQEEQIRRDQEALDFVQTFPNVKKEDIKPETWAKIEQGVPLKFAYMEQMNQELMTRIQVLEQNQKNLQQAPVQGVSTHGHQEDAESDPFMEGFNSI